MRFSRRKLFASLAALPFLRKDDNPPEQAALIAARKRVLDSCNVKVPYVPYPGQFETDPEAWRENVPFTIQPAIQYDDSRVMTCRQCLPDGTLGPLRTVEVSPNLSDGQLNAYRNWRIKARRLSAIR